MPKFQMRELIGSNTITARLGAGTTANDRYNDKEVGKLVKMVGDSRYDFAVAGNEIEGRVTSVDTASSDGYSTGAVQVGGRMHVILDGVQATPGTGAVALLDFVLASTPVAKGTAQPDAGPKVVKATDQAAAKNSPFAWRVVSFLSGSGAVGTLACIEKVGNVGG